MKKKPTITVGVPAYNEEGNISNLLKSVLEQKSRLFTLEKIIVISDGSNDQTTVKVCVLAKKYPIIKLILGEERLGKASRLNQLYQLNTSDIILTLDADIILSEPKVIEKLVQGFNNKRVVVVGGNNQPVKAKTLTERIYNAGYRMWYEMRKDYRNGHNLNNFHGMAVGLRKSFAKSFTLPPTSGDGAFVCMMAKKQKKKFQFIKSAIVFFHSVNNLQDFFTQSIRNLNSKHELVKFFGDQFYQEQKITNSYKIKGILKTFFQDPFYTFLALCLQIGIRIFPTKKGKVYQNGIWQISTSTKKAIRKYQIREIYL